MTDLEYRPRMLRSFGAARGQQWTQAAASWAIFAIALSIGQPGVAEDLEPDWISVRHSGMGNASTATSTDSESVFANPAGLTRIRNPRSRNGIHEVNIPRISIVGSDKELKAIGGGFGQYERNPLLDAFSKLNPKGNSEFRQEVRVFPSVVFGGKSAATWVLGAFGDNRTTIEHQAGNPNGTYLIQRDVTVGGAIGVSGSSRGGTFSYGLSLRPNARYFSSENNVTIDPDNPPNYSTSFMALTQTTGIGLDGGILFTAADFWLPTLGIAVRNIPTGCVADVMHPYAKSTTTICGSVRTGSRAPEHPRTMVDPTDVRLGFSMTPRFMLGPERLNLRLSAEASHLAIPMGASSYGLPDVPLERMLSAGVELFFGHPMRSSGLAFRAGTADGGPTWGASIELWVLALEYSSFLRQTSFEDKTSLVVRDHMLGMSTKL